MRYRTVLFDLDGTLLDHFKAIHRCHSYTMQRLGLPPPTMDQVHAAVGAGVEVAVRRLVGPERTAEALAIYRPHWDATMLDDVELLPGARELLLALRDAGCTAAVLTNKHGPSSRKVCAHLGVAPLLAGIYGAGDLPWLKPAIEFTHAALKGLAAEAATTCLVGDSPYDVQTARNAGLGLYAVTTGTHDAAELQTAGATPAEIFPGLPAVHAALFAR